ncbi:hypothetical protein [Lacticaseibacillus yichunensis]|uniref:Uncharacterized protein n=1 Tax=Lacticaseibacillus yichunensis TaxID=2486015 RepID=A0ABW4CS63_9LACO|nr:hypothetical protein [Lacticaseibacillus yichunensis]
MNKNQLKMMHYGTTIDKVMKDTEAQQEVLSPLFEALRSAIDAGTEQAFDAETYTETKTAFTAGTAVYAGLSDKLASLAAPARLMGNHVLLKNTYADFVAGCQAMTASLGDAPADLDVAAFNSAEAAQDEATDKLMKYLQRISALV